MNKRRRLTGFVTSDKMDKTVVVEVKRTFQHSVYKKTVHSLNRVMAHDELGCQVGDQVLVVESQPISARKHWVVQQILRRATGAETPLETLEVPDETEAQE
jgi:small subunit ribosomal protein S17